jgi:hypothetical protein
MIELDCYLGVYICEFVLTFLSSLYILDISPL